MVLGGTAIDAYIIVYCNNAGETVCCLVHLHLKDILGHPKTEGHMQKPVSAMMCIESGQIQRFSHLCGCSRSHLQHLPY